MALKGTVVPLRNGMIIYYEPADSGRALTTAEVLRDEMLACYGVEMRVTPAKAPPPQGSILIGNAEGSPISSAELKKQGLRITPDPPGLQGCILVARDKRILIAGTEAQGTFYGTQALLMLVRKARNGG